MAAATAEQLELARADCNAPPIARRARQAQLEGDAIPLTFGASSNRTAPATIDDRCKEIEGQLADLREWKPPINMFTAWLASYCVDTIGQRM